MATTIKVGTVFIQDRLRIFRTLALESEPYMRKLGTLLQSRPNAGLGQRTRGTGWNHFFMVRRSEVLRAWQDLGQKRS